MYGHWKALCGKLFNEICMHVCRIFGLLVNATWLSVCVLILQRLDRAWYDMDSGYDETQNPFADVSEEYTKKKEENMAKKAVKRMSAQQRQINKVNAIVL